MGCYVCCGCGEAFRQPVRVPEASGEVHWVSPCCGEDYREAVPCALCGRPVSRARRRHGLCPRCAGESVARFARRLEEFSPEEREVINDAYDGVPLTGRPAA